MTITAAHNTNNLFDIEKSKTSTCIEALVREPIEVLREGHALMKPQFLTQTRVPHSSQHRLLNPFLLISYLPTFASSTPSLCSRCLTLLLRVSSTITGSLSTACSEHYSISTCNFSCKNSDQIYGNFVGTCSNADCLSGKNFTGLVVLSCTSLMTGNICDTDPASSGDVIRPKLKQRRYQYAEWELGSPQYFLHQPIYVYWVRNPAKRRYPCSLSNPTNETGNTSLFKLRYSTCRKEKRIFDLFEVITVSAQRKNQRKNFSSKAS